MENQKIHPLIVDCRRLGDGSAAAGHEVAYGHLKQLVLQLGHLSRAEFWRVRVLVGHVGHAWAALHVLRKVLHVLGVGHALHVLGVGHALHVLGVGNALHVWHVLRHVAAVGRVAVELALGLARAVGVVERLVLARMVLLALVSLADQTDIVLAKLVGIGQAEVELVSLAHQQLVSLQHLAGVVVLFTVPLEHLLMHHLLAHFRKLVLFGTRHELLVHARRHRLGLPHVHQRALVLLGEELGLEIHHGVAHLRLCLCLWQLLRLWQLL